MRRIRIKGVNDMKEYAFGIDLGGTTAKVGLFTTSGKLLEKWEVSTDTSNNGAHILENLAAAVQQKMQEKGLSADEVEGVGLGVPGPVLDSSIVPIVCANLGGWGNRNVSIELSELLGGIRVLVGNDANVAALGEIWMGTAQGCRSAVMVTLGTGVGGGLVLNGKSITGHSYITGEFGHIRLPVDALEVVGRDFPLLRCGCGQLGCIENYLSGRGFAWLYEHFYQQPLSSPEIVAQWQQHDPRAQAHVERYLDLLAVCLGNILTIVDPDLLVLGGGLSNFTALSEGLAQRLPRHLLPVARVPRIERARHGDAGGMRGAAFLHLTH